MATPRGRRLCPVSDVNVLSRTTGWAVGLDEVGAGCLAGPLCVAAFAYPVEQASEIVLRSRVVDSKKLSPEKRALASEELKALSTCVHKLLWVEPSEIERINIFWARMKAFWELIIEMESQLPNSFYLVDGPKLGRKAGVTPSLDELEMMELEKRILSESKADNRFFAVAAASILAKEARDSLMKELAPQYEKYNWAANKGYATADHIEAIETHGLTSFHRVSFCKNFS